MYVYKQMFNALTIQITTLLWSELELNGNLYLCKQLTIKSLFLLI